MGEVSNVKWTYPGAPLSLDGVGKEADTGVTFLFRTALAHLFMKASKSTWNEERRGFKVVFFIRLVGWGMVQGQGG